MKWLKTKWWPKLFGGLILGGALVACAGLTLNAQMAVACTSYKSSLTLVTMHKAKLTEMQVRNVDRVIALVGPQCRAASSGETTTKNVLAAVQKSLAELVRIEGAVR